MKKQDDKAPAKTAASVKADRLKVALKANLQKRKAQAKARQSGSSNGEQKQD